jgi:hypothetical protein
MEELDRYDAAFKEAPAYMRLYQQVGLRPMLPRIVNAF